MKCPLYRVWDGHGRAKSATRAVDGTVERNSRAEPPRRTSQHPISGGAYSLTWSLAVQRRAAGSPVFQSPDQTDRSSDVAHGSFVWFLGSPNNVRERFCGSRRCIPPRVRETEQSQRCRWPLMHTASAVAPCRRGQTGRETPPRDASPVHAETAGGDGRRRRSSVRSPAPNKRGRRTKETQQR